MFACPYSDTLFTNIGASALSTIECPCWIWSNATPCPADRNCGTLVGVGVSCRSALFHSVSTSSIRYLWPATWCSPYVIGEVYSALNLLSSSPPASLKTPLNVAPSASTPHFTTSSAHENVSLKNGNIPPGPNTLVFPRPGS